jgi:hypothetical protein
LPDPAAALGFSFGTDPKVIVDVLPQPLLLTAVEPPELLLDPEPELPPMPESPDEPDDPVLEPEPWPPEPLLDAAAPLPPPLLLAPELPLEPPEPDALLVPELPELGVPPLPDMDPLLMPESGPVLELLEPLPHATAIKARHAGVCAHLRYRGASSMVRWFFMSDILSGTLVEMPTCRSSCAAQSCHPFLHSGRPSAAPRLSGPAPRIRFKASGTRGTSCAEPHEATAGVECRRQTVNRWMSVSIVW